MEVDLKGQVKLENLPDVMDIKDLMRIMNVGKATATRLIHSSGFPAFKVGRQYRIGKASFITWLNGQSLIKDVAE